MNKYVLDTHTILWYLLGFNKLPAKIKKIIEEQKELSSIYVPIIVLAEIALILEKDKVKGDLNTLLFAIKSDSRFVIVPFDETVFESFLNENKNLEMHDRIITATAKTLKAYLITKDKLITKYYQKVIW